jgi:hypothetical protein
VDEKMKNLLLYHCGNDKNKMLLLIMSSIYDQYREEYSARWF